MKEKTKKYFIITAYKAVFAVGVFLALLLTGLFAPGLINKISPVWTENINIKKAGMLFYSLLKELFPF